MGWWDDVKGLGTGIYNNVSNVVDGIKALPVPSYAGRDLNDIKDAGTAFYNNMSVTNIVSGVSNYSYNTVRGLFEQVAVIPKLAYSVAFHPGTRMVAAHALRTVVEDLLPLVLVTYTNDMMQRYGRDYLQDEPNAAFLSIDTAIMSGLGLLQLATWTYSTRKKLQMTVRTTVLTIEAGRVLNGVNNTPKMTLCHDEKCSMLRFIQGSIRDLAAFIATEAAISLIGYIPFAGGFVAAVLSVHHRGRYVMTVVLPDLCNRHQVEYLMEHSELAFSLGLGHALLSNLAVGGVEHVTTIPAIWYEAAVNQFMMFTTMSVAAHLSMPPAVSKSLRKLPDPVAAYQALIGVTLDTVMLGLKKQIPRMLKQPSSNIDWKMVADFALIAWRHPVARKIVYILVPRMLGGKQAFINDPVIAPNWAGLRESLIIAIQSIEAVKSYVFVKIGVLKPNVTATGLWLIFGMPYSAIEVCLKLIGNEKFMMQVSNLRRKLEALDGIGESELAPKEQSYELRDERSLNKPSPVSVRKNNENEQETQVVAHNVIRPQPKPGKFLDPRKVIMPDHKFFKNPKNIICPENKQSTRLGTSVSEPDTKSEQDPPNIFSYG